MNYKEKFKNLPRSPWFNGSIRPAHIGVYERYFDNIDKIVLQYWNGNYWYAGTDGFVLSLHQDCKMWRGCIKKSDDLV